MLSPSPQQIRWELDATNISAILAPDVVFRNQLKRLGNLPTTQHYDALAAIASSSGWLNPSLVKEVQHEPLSIARGTA